ncbi:hypothetical protein ACF1A5_09420 [Streptomyces sp. NPDC014864]|uniref:hypothetical protein n=1 Tax=Streptomyces sp. NPDC014864 TaxID=3364924 RepID=UPI0036FCE6E4
MGEKEDRAARVYGLTGDLALSNMWWQGLSAVVGFGVPILVDGAALVAYSDLWSDVRTIYGKGRISAHAAKEYLKPNLGFLVQDFLWDKVIGQIPLIGIPFNVAFAKATTWRLGAWFGALAALGDGDDEATNGQVVGASMDLIKRLFPSTGSVFDFKSPDRETFIALIASLDGLSAKTAEDRFNNALAALRGEHPES